MPSPPLPYHNNRDSSGSFYRGTSSLLVSFPPSSHCSFTRSFLLLNSFSRSQYLCQAKTLQMATALLSFPSSTYRPRRRSLAVRCSDEAPLEDPPILGTKVVLPRKKPLKWSTGTAPGEYGGPPTTSGLRRYFTFTSSIVDQISPYYAALSFHQCVDR